MGLTHGSIVESRAGIIGQVVGIPAPPGYVAVLPKYVWCSDASSPWRRRDGPLCRVVSLYGPWGLSAAAEAAGLRLLADPLYGAPMPYVSMDSIVRAVDPREALSILYTHGPGDPRIYAAVESIARGAGVGLEDLGLTGSLAMGGHHASSDVDLVVHGCDQAARVAEYLWGLRLGVRRSTLGGVRVSPSVDLSWRRLVYEGRSVTLVGVPRVWHCPVLESYYRIVGPEARIRSRLSVRPGDCGFLLYPPCGQATDGTWIVSFEYNVGWLLYSGGDFLVEGVGAREPGIVYIGTREFPGALYRV